MKNLYIGIMSGTSLDGIDCVLAEIHNNNLQVVAKLEHPLPPSLRDEILRLNTPGGKDELHRVATLDRHLGLVFADAVNTLLKSNNLDTNDISAIGSHGQTLRHQPYGEHQLAYTVQIGDPNTIAEATGITTIADFRRRDIAAGGQGAPLVPAFHQAMFQSDKQDRIILNIGGMANITVLKKDGSITGYDTGPGNCLMDGWIALHKQESYDKDGTWAQSGKVSDELLAAFMTHPFFAAPPPKSTGRETFNKTWVASKVAAFRLLSAADVQATLTELAAQSISDAIKQHSDNAEIYVCGGGANNAYLISRITELTKLPTHSTAKLNIEPNWVEALAFAWMAKQTLEKKTSTLSEVTGATHPCIAGGIYYA